jgi:hypothetical protein
MYCTQYTTFGPRKGDRQLSAPPDLVTEIADRDDIVIEACLAIILVLGGASIGIECI